jgi:FeS assembly SUF system regulator
MLKISRLTDYATAIVLYLEKHNQLHSTDSLAKAVNLEIPTVSKILKLLTKATILTSIRGANGGYQLAKEVSDISLYDVIIAIEGSAGITECTSSESICIQEQGCDTRSGWQKVNDDIKNILLKMTIERMAELNGASKPIISLLIKE